MPTSLVTGGAGFLGSHLCDRLLGEGHRVICVDNLDTGTLENIEHIRSPAFVFAHHDMIGHLEVSEPIDYVFHLASPASPIDYLRLPLHTLKVGSYGTHNALGLAKAHRARFLLASTSEVYGDPREHPQHEGYWGHVNPIGPRGVLRRGKRYAEALTMAYHRQHGVDTAHRAHLQHLRPPHAPQRRPRVPNFIRQALPASRSRSSARDKPARSVMSGPGRGLSAPDRLRHPEPVNLGNPGEFTILELAELLIELTASSSSVVHEALPQDDPAVRRPDISLARELLDWEPTVELREGLVMTLSGMNAELPLRR